ncbi:hypothetical protein LZ554_001987 [Drepanopeziza brunnea f. sp. 'monogermtubi']|nr:hypothetical protein LZ554_001987 [Drepanopeziza brunnea f. sp. 'monogermtubi']
MSQSSPAAASSGMAAALTTFTFFSSLPQELQDQIWEEYIAQLGPVTVSIRRAKRQPRDARVDIFAPGYMSNAVHERWSTRSNRGPASFPAIMGVSQRARLAGQRHFSLAFGGVDNFPVWIRWGTDTVSMPLKFLREMYYQDEDSVFSDGVADVDALMDDCTRIQMLEERSAIPLAPQNGLWSRNAASNAFAGRGSTERFVWMTSLRSVLAVASRTYSWNWGTVPADEVGDPGLLFMEQWWENGRVGPAPALMLEDSHRFWDFDLSAPAGLLWHPGPA